METIRDLATRPLIGSDAPTKNTSKPDEAAFARLVPLWQHMTGIYGHKWVSSFGEEVSETWVRGCMGLTGEELARGLHACLHRSTSNRRIGDDDWPPTLGEFHALCRPQRPVYHETYPRLPAPTLTDEQRQRIEDDIAALRATLRHDRIQQNIARNERVAATQKYERIPGSDDEQPEVAA